MGQAGLKAQPSFLHFPSTDTSYKLTQYAQLLQNFWHRWNFVSVKLSLILEKG